MAVVATVEHDASVDEYRRVKAALDMEITPPAGLILHALVDLGNDRFRSIDVWDSPEAALAFYEDRLRPIIARAVPELADFQLPEMREVLDLIQP